MNKIIALKTMRLLLLIYGLLGCLISLVFLIRQESHISMTPLPSLVLITLSFWNYTTYTGWKKLALGIVPALLSWVLWLYLFPEGLELTLGQLLGASLVVLSLAGLSHWSLRGMAR